MLDEGSGVMEKRLPSRQSPAQPKNNGAISEKKSDYVSNKNGRHRKFKQSNNGGRQQESTPNPKFMQKYSQSFGDKRPRPRGYSGYRQSEEVAELDDPYDVGERISSRKGSANHLLQFSYTPRGENSHYGGGRGSGGRSNRGGNWYSRKSSAKVFKPEQFLQASCQFVVREGGEYTEQSINPDALVSWDLVELVRTFSTETVTCPICLEIPAAGKITKCGHTFCWACILHHLQEKEMNGAKPVCPICPRGIAADELRSVHSMEVPDYKVGDEIEMKLMRKSKGSVYVAPKSEWMDRVGQPHNINDGGITQYTKLLLASCDQIQNQVIDPEKVALDFQAQSAEEFESIYIDMAKSLLEKRELTLKVRALSLSDSDKEEQTVTADDKEELKEAPETVPLPPDMSFDGTKIATQYADAFENEEEGDSFQLPMEESNSMSDSVFQTSTEEEGDSCQSGAASNKEEVNVTSSTQEHESLLEPGSPNLSLPLMSQQGDSPGIMTPDEAADHLELPEAGGSGSQQRMSNRTKDTYYFYQAATGQHIYMSSLNAQCLTKEYGSLENSPETIKATIVAIERTFMTEDVRKRLRYLSHIPLTCEFHVVELKIRSPVVSKETLNHFHPEFEKRRKARQKKMKDEKARAKLHEVEHKKSFGIYPEVQIPLDSLTQFPSHLPSSQSTGALSAMMRGNVAGMARQRQDSEMSATSDAVSEPSIEGQDRSPLASSPRSRNDSEGSDRASVSFAQMLMSGKSAPQTGVWGHSPAPVSPIHSSATMPELRALSRQKGANDEDDVDGEYLPAPTIQSAWLDGMSRVNVPSSPGTEFDENGNPGQPADGKGGKKNKKKKQKTVLFSTTMARK